MKKFCDIFLLRLLLPLGKLIIAIFESIGEKVIFTLVAFAYIFVRPFYWKNLLIQIKEIAFFSLPIVGLTAFFTGMVLALQAALGFANFGSESAIATIVLISITRELGPVLTALMVSGRISASMAAEIGTMQVSEQVDALYTMNINPIKYLITPKILAGIISLPFLVIVSDIIGVMGGFLISVLKLHYNPSYYLQSTLEKISYQDIYSGLIKALIFGIIITSMGCFFGYKTRNGAVGVGKSTTNAVVVSCILIFVLDYLLTLVFF